MANRNFLDAIDRCEVGKFHLLRGADRTLAGKPTAEGLDNGVLTAMQAGSLIFVNSMSDLFQDAVPDEFIRRVFATMQDCPQHTFQILTKRSERLREFGPSLRWPENVWMGVSVEDERVANRIRDLASVPAQV